MTEQAGVGVGDDREGDQVPERAPSRPDREGDQQIERAPSRAGRGRLSSIDLLPEEAEPDVEWALEELRERKMHQTEIYAAFNERLAAKKLGPISFSAFNRYSVRKAVQFRKLDEARRVSGELVAALGAEGSDEMTIAVSEMLKLAAFQMLESGVKKTDDVQALARALQAATSAQKTSEEVRRKIEQRIFDKADKAIDAVAKEGGLSADRVAQLRRDFLGVRTA